MKREPTMARFVRRSLVACHCFGKWIQIFWFPASTGMTSIDIYSSDLIFHGDSIFSLLFWWARSDETVVVPARNEMNKCGTSCHYRYEPHTGFIAFYRPISFWIKHIRHYSSGVSSIFGLRFRNRSTARDSLMSKREIFILVNFGGWICQR